MSTITKKEKDEVCFRIDQETLDYTFRGYSEWDEIKDPEFHRLRLAYTKAADDLEAYLSFKDFDASTYGDEPEDDSEDE